MSSDQGDAQTKSAFDLRYAAASGVVDSELRLVAAMGRDQVQASGSIADPVPLREALSALYAVVQSDARYKPKDRTAYLAYQRMRKQTAGLSNWAAQQAYFDWLARNDPNAWVMLDPIVTVHPDALLLEVFSKDEGCYGQLALDWSAVELDGSVSPGTTHVDFSTALFDGIQRMRSYRDTRLKIGAESVAVSAGDEQVIEKRIQVPDSWLRGLLQVQSASTLAQAAFSIAPMDLYNALRQLRMNKDQKRKGRAVRVELVPGEPVRLVLEPWETVVECGGANYGGRTAQVFRIWGRRRLMLMRRFLPFVESIDVRLMGSGLPNFWVLRAGPISLTLGLTGFTAVNWSRSLSFDVLLPRPAEQTAEMKKVLDLLTKKWVASRAEVEEATKLKPADALRALQASCQAGLVMYDVARDVYRLRPLTAEPLDPERLRYRNERERAAHDLLATSGAVKQTHENRIHGEGLEITGKVAVAAEKREYRPQMLIAEDGAVRRAECSCAFYRKNKLKSGPCAHLIALRVQFARLTVKRAAQRGKARKTVVTETRTYVRRHPRGETVYQLSLDRARLKVRWGERAADPRLQSLVFDDVDGARAAYFERVDALEADGFLDASAAG